MDEVTVVEEATTIFNWLLGRVKQRFGGNSVTRRHNHEETDFFQKEDSNLTNSEHFETRDSTRNHKRRCDAKVRQQTSKTRCSKHDHSLDNIFNDVFLLSSPKTNTIHFSADKLKVADRNWLECVARKRHISEQISRELSKQAKLCEEKQRQRKKIAKLTNSVRNAKRSLHKWNLKKANLDQT